MKKKIKKFLTGSFFQRIEESIFQRHSKKLQGIQPVNQIYYNRSQEKDFCPLENMPAHLIRYAILLEDRLFYKHLGVDFYAILRVTYLNLKMRQMRYGASTITQQLCKNLYFGFRGSLGRKIQEFFLSLWIESKLTKDQILELYLNIIYFGNGQYGITDASQYYFGVHPSKLSINQAFSLMCMLPFPGIKNPLVYPDEFCSFKNKKATHLYKLNVLSSNEYQKIACQNAATPDESLRKAESINRWYSEHVPWYNERFGPFPEVREEEKIVICTVSGEGYGAVDKVQKAIAHVIMNRIGFREWRNYKTAEEIIKNTGFDAYSMRSLNYRKAEEYLKNRNGLDEEIEKIIHNVIPIIRGQEKDFTKRCVLFYSPMRYRLQCLKRKQIWKMKPNWNFSILQKAKLKGCRGDFAFYRYID